MSVMLRSNLRAVKHAHVCEGLRQIARTWKQRAGGESTEVLGRVEERYERDHASIRLYAAQSVSVRGALGDSRRT